MCFYLSDINLWPLAAIWLAWSLVTCAAYFLTRKAIEDCGQHHDALYILLSGPIIWAYLGLGWLASRLRAARK